MKLTTTGALLIGLGVLGGTPHITFAQTATEQQDAQRQLRSAIQSLQSARYDLVMTDPKFGGERADALQQTQFALEQLFAAVNDDKWKAEDRDLWEKQRREADQVQKNRRDAGTARDVGADKPYVRAESALKNLREARRLVDGVQGSGFSGHKSKSLVFIDEAIKGMEKGIVKSRAGQ